MQNKTKMIIAVFLVILAVFIFIQVKLRSSGRGGEVTQELTPVTGDIQNIISTTGTVLPKNRLEVKPPVNGRVESILVQEGEKVKIGQTIAWMSSTERAALLDAARGQGDEALKYWQETYKAIPLISPIDGEVIVATTQPGQTVTASDAVIVLSDQLIVRAQVDETDIGRISIGQKATVTLDAYPDVKIKVSAGHIYYESKTVNNVTMYEVDLVPEEVPAFFRSGMNATVDFVSDAKENVMILPLEAVEKGKTGSYCLVKVPGGKEAARRPLELGMSDDKNVEIISGLNAGDIVVMKTKKFNIPKGSTGTNPFMPGRKKDAPGAAGRAGH
ncbi:MAG: efflux RND transporter periplasmic adaptor subunit [Candidatus Omnitrophica bacterium]|nr:efflux RND transporter periplasmic adaptor subunit [Candidatus Omnitrophota bacterium]